MLKGLLLPTLNENTFDNLSFLRISGGAFGVFEVTDDISDVCKAKVFKKGSKTRVLVRFSTVGTYENYYLSSSK